ncbi:MAG TPA: phage tail tape measure protein, partial [Bacillota bacterium]|nr:phage tail tape measure protein [Bacillota bacterium]
LKNMQTRMEEAARASQQAARDAEPLSMRMRELGQELGRVGAQMSIGLSAPLAALQGFAAKASMEFETAMAKVWTITDMTKGQLDSLGSQLERLSSSIPQSAQQLAAGLYDAIGSGITDVAEAMQVLEVAAKAGQAGATSTAVAMDALTSAINAYGMEASQAGELADVMFRAMDKGKLTFEEIAGNLGQVISTAAVAGVQFEEIAAAFATLTKGGVGAAEAATAVNQAILTIIQPSEQAAAYAEQLGIEFNAAALASKGLSGVLEDVYRATGGNIESMTTLFSNVRALKGALGLTRNEMQDYKSDLDSMATASGAAERAFEKQMQTSAAQAQLFRNEIANLGRAFGAELLPMLNSLIERIKPLVQAFTELSDGAKQAAIVFAAVTAAIGPLMAAVGGLVTLMSGPAGWIVAITAVGSALYGLVSSVRDLEGQVDRQIDRTRTAITEAMSQADAYGRQADALDKLISEYDELAGKPDQSEAEHERLRQVIDEIVRLAPTAVTGYDDMGQALIGNAEAARAYRDELWNLRNDQLQLAAMRVKYELPRLEEQLERYTPEFKKVKAELDQIRDQYWAMRRYIFEVSRTDDFRKQEKLLEEAITAGIFERGIPPATQYAAIEKQYNTLYDRYSTLSAIIEKATAAVIELRKAEEELAEHQKLKPGKSVSRVTPGPSPAPSTATPGSQAAAQALSDWEAFGQKVKALSKDAYGALQQGWEDIERGLTSTDPAVRTWAEARARALLKVITEALTQFKGDWTQAANAASIEVKSGFQSIRKQFEESARSASKSAENQFAQYGAKVRELSRDAYGGLIDEWDAIAAALASDDPVARTWATTRANTLTKVINDAITETSGTTADQWAAAVAAVVKEIESGYESVRRKVREGVSDDDFVRGLIQDVERKATLEDWGYEQTADAIQRILDAETMSAKLRGDLAYRVAVLRKDAAAEAAKAEKTAAEQAAREAEKAAKEAAAQQEQHVRDRIQAVQREAALNDWSYSQIADALQEVLDTEEMAARTRVDLAYDVALNRKRAADKATADEKRAAEEAAKAAEQQAREA